MVDKDSVEQAERGGDEPGAPPEESDEGTEAPAEDLPFDPAFAPLTLPYTFWQDCALLVLMGGFMGAFGYGYLKAITTVNNLWMSTDGNAAFPAASTLGFGGGRAWWIGLCGGAGVAVGLTKALLNLDTSPSFIDELRALHVEPVAALKTAAVSMMGLMAGVPMGPEAGLGAVAGAVGTLAGTRMRSFVQQPQDRARLYVASSMCSVFAALLPSPLAALLLTIELGRTPTKLPGLSVMHIITQLSLGATAAFAVYYAIATYPFLDPQATFLYALAEKQYNQLYLVEGILFGLMGAALGFLYLVIAGAVKAVMRPLRAALDARLGFRPRAVLLATAGGAVVGALGWAMPLVLTDGSGMLGSVMTQGSTIGSSVLAASCFAKIFAYHLSVECGFAGGIFLPMLSMSTMLGRIFVNETGVSPVVALSCSIIALAAAVVPAPFFLAVLSVSVLMVGPQGLVPIFVCATVSHLLFLGVGLPQALMAAGNRRARAAAAAASASKAAE